MSTKHVFPSVDPLDVLTTASRLLESENGKVSEPIREAVGLICGQQCKEILQKYGILDEYGKFILERKNENLTELEKKWEEAPLLKLKNQDKLEFVSEEGENNQVYYNRRIYWIADPQSNIEKGIEIRETLVFHSNENNSENIEKCKQLCNECFSQIFEVGVMLKEGEKCSVGCKVADDFQAAYNISTLLIGDEQNSYHDFCEKNGFKPL